MTIPNTFASGVNTSFSTELNENFTYTDYRVIASNTTSTTLSSSTATTTLVNTVAVGAAEVTQFIEVNVDYAAIAKCVPGGSVNGYVDIIIAIGLSGSEAEASRRRLSYAAITSTAGLESGNAGTYSFYYEPTSGEKSAGFNVKVSCVTKGDNANSSFTHYTTRVFGK